MLQVFRRCELRRPGNGVFPVQRPSGVIISIIRIRMGSSLHAQIVIPARLASTRLPRKLLLSETGKPLIQHTYEAAQKARLAGGVCVAADSEEIATAVREFGGSVVMTDPACASG